jgi:recombination protein RecA
MAPPFREVEFDIMYGEGISKEGDVLDLAADSEIIEKSGAWFAFEGERIGQGRENAKEFLKAHPDVMDKIERAVLAKHGITRIGDPLAAAPAPAPPNGAAPEEKRAPKRPDPPRA